MHQDSTPIIPNSVCEYCGKPFVSRTGTNRTRFCSKTCVNRGKMGRTLAMDTPYDLGNGTAVVFLGNARTALIDSDDIPRVSERGWIISKGDSRPDYVSGSSGGKAVYLHRFVMNAQKGDIVDHINHDTMDNRKSNLRFATHRDNVANQRVRQGGTGYKGGQIRCDGKKWVARIQVDRKGHYLGSFTTPEDAARAYDEAAILHFGEFALLNFPPQ